MPATTSQVSSNNNNNNNPNRSEVYMLQQQQQQQRVGSFNRAATSSQRTNTTSSSATARSVKASASPVSSTDPDPVNMLLEGEDDELGSTRFPPHIAEAWTTSTVSSVAEGENDDSLITSPSTSVTCPSGPVLPSSSGSFASKRMGSRRLMHSPGTRVSPQPKISVPYSVTLVSDLKDSPTHNQSEEEGKSPEDEGTRSGNTISIHTTSNNSTNSKSAEEAPLPLSTATIAIPSSASSPSSFLFSAWHRAQLRQRRLLVLTCGLTGVTLATSELVHRIVAEQTETNNNNNNNNNDNTNNNVSDIASLVCSAIAIVVLLAVTFVGVAASRPANRGRQSRVVRHGNVVAWLYFGLVVAAVGAFPSHHPFALVPCFWLLFLDPAMTTKKVRHSTSTLARLTHALCAFACPIILSGFRLASLDIDDTTEKETVSSFTVSAVCFFVPAILRGVLRTAADSLMQQAAVLSTHANGSEMINYNHIIAPKNRNSIVTSNNNNNINNNSNNTGTSNVNNIISLEPNNPHVQNKKRSSVESDPAGTAVPMDASTTTTATHRNSRNIDLVIAFSGSEGGRNPDDDDDEFDDDDIVEDGMAFSIPSMCVTPVTATSLSRTPPVEESESSLETLTASSPRTRSRHEVATQTEVLFDVSAWDRKSSFGTCSMSMLTYNTEDKRQSGMTLPTTTAGTFPLCPPLYPLRGGSDVVLSPKARPIGAVPESRTTLETSFSFPENSSSLYPPTPKISQRLSTTSSIERSPSTSSVVSSSWRQSVATVTSCIKWKKGLEIGRGGHGVVHVAMNEVTGELMAAKTLIFDAADPSVQTRLASLQTELTLLRCLRHEHIVRYLFTERVELGVIIFMEYVPGGTILQALRQFGPLPFTVISRYLQQILSALSYMHALKVVHGDVKAANVLLTTDGMCKLSDFGGEGTPLWLAPEAHLNGSNASRNARSDVWAVGCLVLEMITAVTPFGYLDLPPPKIFDWLRNTADMDYNFFDAAALEAHARIGPIVTERYTATERSLLYDFVSNCLVRDPLARWCVEDLASHGLITSVCGDGGGPGQTSPLTSSSSGLLHHANSFLSDKGGAVSATSPMPQLSSPILTTIPSTTTINVAPQQRQQQDATAPAPTTTTSSSSTNSGGALKAPAAGRKSRSISVVGGDKALEEVWRRHVEERHQMVQDSLREDSGSSTVQRSTVKVAVKKEKS
eukprot:PhM_4_TR8293/c3_g1_i2/m.40627/K17533/MAP3K19, YSK4; mitogen-activated protein kinase kinase kinase 19